MYNVAEKFTSTNKAGLEALNTIINTSLTGIGELATLNLQTARAFAERGAENFAALSEVRDLAGLKALQKPMAMAALDQSMAYSRRAYKICNESSSTVTQVFEGHLRQVAGDLFATINDGRKNLPPVVGFAAATAKSLMAAAKQVYGQASEVGRQVADSAQASATVAGESAVKLLAKPA